MTQRSDLNEAYLLRYYRANRHILQMVDHPLKKNLFKGRWKITGYNWKIVSKWFIPPPASKFSSYESWETSWYVMMGDWTWRR